MTERTLNDFGVSCTGIDDALSVQLAAALQRAVDPELGVDMLNMGLVYRMRKSGPHAYQVQMLLTQIGCPLTDYLEKMVLHALQLVDADVDAQIQFCLQPAWTPARMSRVARMQLGVH
ncbi:metal-sulfur cluster assembly factor [Lacticaseibacillus songhuajiangensis]|uniref:metal-sulfur cluster assembly factor n=1 Tax=Lacticaseibacillus songhuajiangensis TaxID=1296539 RepID=UPI000F7B58A1|nr:metal-sulfur cluster assembly factor [Lacticaseibacillus songhuajiangensis]